MKDPVGDAGTHYAPLSTIYFPGDAENARSVEPVVESFRELGFRGWQALPIGVVELVCVALYTIPRTSALGAVMLTGYLGGAVRAHFRAESPLFSTLFSTTLFPVHLGIAVWAGLYPRNEKVRALVRGA